MAKKKNKNKNVRKTQVIHSGDTYHADAGHDPTRCGKCGAKRSGYGYKSGDYNISKVLKSKGGKKPCSCTTNVINIININNILSDLSNPELQLMCPKCKCIWVNTYLFEDRNDSKETEDD